MDQYSFSLKRILKRQIALRGWHVGRYEVDWSTAMFLPLLFDHLDINCVIDAGARFGEFAQLIRSVGYAGDILSFEPIARNLDTLFEVSAHDDRWHVIPSALGNRTESAVINVMDGTNFSSFLEPNKYGSTFQGNVSDHAETVSVYRLDSLFEQVTGHIKNPRVYLKMDTQGWDLQVFRGAAGCLDNIFALQSELSVRSIYEGMPDFREALAEYNRAGFVESAMFAVTRDRSFRLVEFDCVMVRDSGSAQAEADVVRCW